MPRGRLEECKDGWFIGSFVPSVYQTPKVEVAYKQHAKGAPWPCHYQRTAVEITLLLRGRLRMTYQDGREDLLLPGDVLVLPPGPAHAATPTFEEDCAVVVVKLPSRPGDKVVC